ncbi:MAG: MoaD/ThiS family protein [Holophaga sp.]|nr:MoaD/ThiS family protein [Holophaga sp.]
MKIQLRAFARYRDLLGFETLQWDFPEPTTLADLLLNPQLAALPKEALLAVNQSFAAKETILADGDEVALMPPVSGG